MFDDKDLDIKVKTKVQAARDFTDRVTKMTNDELVGLMLQEVGDDLAAYFVDYTVNLLKNDPKGFVLKNSMTLMLMGYLMRADEDLNTEKSIAEQLQQPVAKA